MKYCKNCKQMVNPQISTKNYIEGLVISVISFYFSFFILPGFLFTLNIELIIAIIIAVVSFFGIIIVSTHLSGVNEKTCPMCKAKNWREETNKESGSVKPKVNKNVQPKTQGMKYCKKCEKMVDSERIPGWLIWCLMTGGIVFLGIAIALSYPYGLIVLALSLIAAVITLYLIGYILKNTNDEHCPICKSTDLEEEPKRHEK